MRSTILFVLGRYLPEKNAGIENYTHLLAKLLMVNNHQVEVAILHKPDMEPYIFEGVPIIPLKEGIEDFEILLKEKRYDICHIQEYSGDNGINIAWFQIAKQNCRKIFFTFHLPYLTCYKNDFRYKGITDCNDFSNPARCVSCIIATRLSYKNSDSVSFRNLLIDLATPLLKLTSKSGRLKKNINLRQDILDELISTCDHIFVYAPWFKGILNANGYNSPSIRKIPYQARKVSLRTFPNNKLLKKKILFAGRIEPQKGLHLLCKAMKLISTPDIQLHVYGNIVDKTYFENCAREFPLIFKKTLPLKDLLQILPEYDFFILPSVFTEMYSMMVKDAFQNRLPVIASAAKGNVDVIKEGKNGFIFEYNNYKDLARVIDKCYSLKQNGWQPEFETTDDSEIDTKEIISYYEIYSKALST